MDSTHYLTTARQFSIHRSRTRSKRIDLLAWFLVQRYRAIGYNAQFGIKFKRLSTFHPLSLDKISYKIRKNPKDRRFHRNFYICAISIYFYSFVSESTFYSFLQFFTTCFLSIFKWNLEKSRDKYVMVYVIESLFFIRENWIHILKLITCKIRMKDLEKKS